MFSPDGASALTEGGPGNGALIIATAENTSGRSSAHQAATGEPKSWPITAVTERQPSAATSPRASRTRLNKRNDATSPS